MPSLKRSKSSRSATKFSRPTGYKRNSYRPIYKRGRKFSRPGFYPKYRQRNAVGRINTRAINPYLTKAYQFAKKYATNYVKSEFRKNFNY